MDTLKIDNIIVKSFSGQASEEEKSYLDTWLDLSETNRKYYEHVIHVLETLKKEKEGEFEIPDINAEWEILKNKIHLKQRRKNLVFLRIAAIFMIILGTSFLFMYNSRSAAPQKQQLAEHKKADQDSSSQKQKQDTGSDTVQPAELQKNQYNTINDVQELFLADNSKIILDAHSELIFKDQKTVRKAYLNGSAAFHVKHMDNRNFLLSTHDLEVHVVGTIFEINESSNKKKIDIFVEEGQIEVYSKKDKANKQVISAGECYVYNVKQDTFHQKNTNRMRLKFKDMKTKFKNFFEKE
ncbi:MAG: FecR domain-containing protein [Bacteroidota bacterium]